jgi:hypothetical protein
MRAGIGIASGFALVLAASAGPVHPQVVARDDFPPVWQVDYSLYDLASGPRTAKGVTRTTRLNGVRYLVRPLPDMYTRPEALRGQASQIIESSETINGQTVKGQATITGDSSSRKTFPVDRDTKLRELLLGRAVSVPNCFGALDFMTKGSQNESNFPAHHPKKANTFVINHNLLFDPMVHTVNGRETGSVKEGSILLTGMEVEVPYDFRELVNERQAYPLPAEIPPGYTQVKRTIDYRIIRKPMIIEWQPAHIDVIGHTHVCSQCKPAANSRNYAIEDLPSGNKRRFIHGNVDLVLKIDGRVVTNYKFVDAIGGESGFMILRAMRQWKMPIDDEGRALSRTYTAVTPHSTETIANKWGWDDSGLALFNDAPGHHRDDPPSRWTPFREVKEFLIGVKNFPEFGFITLTVAYDVRKNGFRISQTTPKRLTAEELCKSLRRPESAGPEHVIVPSGTWVDVSE